MHVCVCSAKSEVPSGVAENTSILDLGLIDTEYRRSTIKGASYYLPLDTLQQCYHNVKLNFV